jgi:hypothetical protein
MIDMSGLTCKILPTVEKGRIVRFDKYIDEGLVEVNRHGEYTFHRSSFTNTNRDPIDGEFVDILLMERTLGDEATIVPIYIWPFIRDKVL